MNSILEIAERYNIPVIEDACQAHGAEYYSKDSGSWKKAGSMGRAGAFSFYPGKNLGACGEGGAVTTNDNKLAEKIRMLRDHGQAQKYHHDMAGYNGRLDAIQAGILKVKLGHLSNWGAQRRHCAKRYRELLKSTAGVVLPMEPPWAKAVYHLYVVRVENREACSAVSGRRRHWDRNSLSDSTSPPKSLSQPRLQTRRLPGLRSGGAGDTVTAHVSRVGA